ncbi:Hypothetical predicted protein [Pelobates cultripes]|uniref:Uncharacterized protein n=1 Tax=Pelobates cultripes TaxID=61616 RepID=A0AAD1T6B4_PELCU|nr:Hypothetical predicted protein [Pelobates cultripes]
MQHSLKATPTSCSPAVQDPSEVERCHKWTPDETQVDRYRCKATLCKTSTSPAPPGHTRPTLSCKKGPPRNHREITFVHRRGRRQRDMEPIETPTLLPTPGGKC